MDSSSDESAERQQQLEYYMEFVAFCKLVLEESAASQDAIRPWEDLARVRKYIQSHTALKAAHFETCAAVYHAFQLFLTSQPVDLASPQRQKLLYLLGFIEFCCQVLSESSATHSARAMSDLKRVVKSINKIVTPYRHKIASEQPPSKNPPQCLNNHKDQYHHNPNHHLPLSVSTAHPAKVLPSVQDLLNGTTSNTNLSRTSIDSTQQYTSSAVVDGNGGPYPHGGGADAADEYWHHELHHVYTYITTLVLPHFASLQADTVQQQQQQPPGQPKTSEEAPVRETLSTHRRQTNQHTDLFLQSIDHQHPPSRPDNKDAVGSRASTFESSTFSSSTYGVGASSTYWRKAPEWALNGSNRFGLSMEVIKGGIILEKVELVTSSKSYFVAGRMEPLCDIVLQHPSVSRTHAALQFDAKGQLFLVDLGSTHGTFVNKKRISAADHVELHVGDVVVFGESTRIYTILGPVDLMPDEYSYFPSRSSHHILTLPVLLFLSSSDNLAKLRSKLEARKARRLEQQKDVDEEGASWGFREDAVEEDDSEHSDDSDNDTFSTSTTNKASSKPNVPLPDYLRNRKDDTSGPYVSSVTKDTVNLTKDSKLYTRLQNRIQKLENLKLESSRIRAKQNVGLTDGQEAALARNDTRTQELQDEIEMLEAQLLAKHTQRTTQKEVAAVVGVATTPDLMAEEADSLDMYMLTSAQSLAAQDAAKATANRSRLVERIQETEKLLEIATPAWAKLVVAPPVVADDIPVPVDMTAYVNEG
ncbi:hypothetical protein DYB37_000347 [Aphanomyces astaci]|uniref:FHA domain-containing protein n=1 Tax=Aphanomyces astaci TaxID=112090 RepID=A0A3R7ALK6_APHAT|nr:hypothetical protein DYB37_000347 [Aphanomyces astaci]